MFNCIFSATKDLHLLLFFPSFFSHFQANTTLNMYLFSLLLTFPHVRVKNMLYAHHLLLIITVIIVFLSEELIP